MVQKTYTVDSKLERQSQFGAETVTQSELAKQWIGTLVRPNSNLARARVDASNDCILMTEIKSLKELTKGIYLCCVVSTWVIRFK